MPSYRLATNQDASALAQLRWDFRLEETGGQSASAHDEFIPVCAAFVADGIASGAWAHWVAEHDERLIGCISVCIINKIPKPNKLRDAFGYVTNVYVAPAFRNQAVGSDLLAHVIDWARGRDLENLLVYPSNRSVPFYKRHGFVAEKEALNLELRPYVL